MGPPRERHQGVPDITCMFKEKSWHLCQICIYQELFYLHFNTHWNTSNWHTNCNKFVIASYWYNFVYPFTLQYHVLKCYKRNFLVFVLETEDQQKIRFQIELEFVQCLANPNYLNCKNSYNVDFYHILLTSEIPIWNIISNLFPTLKFSSKII